MIGVYMGSIVLLFFISVCCSLGERLVKTLQRLVY